MTNSSEPHNKSCMDEYDPSLLSVDTALAKIRDAVSVIEENESVLLDHALDRVLAEDLRSTMNVPPYTNSAMDGYAVAGKDLPKSGSKKFELIGTVFAGTPLGSPVPPSHCARIMTGGQMPEGTDTVIMQEHVQIDGNSISIESTHTPGQNVRQAGEDISQGQVVLNRGRRLNAADIGLLASLGIQNVSVKRYLRIAIFSTGDELVPLGTTLQEGQIHDSNRYTLRAMLAKFGATISDYGIIKDDRIAIEETFLDAADKADVLITTGGVSVGEADFVKATLDKHGKVNFWKIAMKPGRPLAFGSVKKCYFFGLPGNPVSTMVTFYQFVLPALKLLQGESDHNRTLLQLRCITPIRKIPGRTEYQRGVARYDENNELVVQSTGGQGSHILSSMSKANCFIILPQNCGNLDAGTMVQVELFTGII